MPSLLPRRVIRRTTASACPIVVALLCIGEWGCSNRERSVPPSKVQTQPSDTVVPESRPKAPEPRAQPTPPETPPAIDLASCRQCVAVGISVQRPDGKVSNVGRIDSSGAFSPLFAPGLAWKRIQFDTYLIGDSIRWIARGGDTIELRYKPEPTDKCVRKYRIRNGWTVTNSHFQAVALEAAPIFARRIDSLLRLGPSFAYVVQGFDATVDPDECEYVPGAIDEFLKSIPDKPHGR